MCVCVCVCACVRVGVRYLVGTVEEVHGDAEGQGVVVGVPEQDGQDLHAGRPGLPLSLLLRPLQ